jgi:hypothetical protein
VRQKKTAASSGCREDVNVPKLLRLVESMKDEVTLPSKYSYVVDIIVARNV